MIANLNKKGKGKGKGKEGKGKEGKRKKKGKRKEIGKKKEKYGFGSHGKISKIFFLGKNSYFSPRGKEYHIFSISECI